MLAAGMTDADLKAIAARFGEVIAGHVGNLGPVAQVAALHAAYFPELEGMPQLHAQRLLTLVCTLEAQAAQHEIAATEMQSRLDSSASIPMDMSVTERRMAALRIKGRLING